jgi:hypothetical protein
MQAQMLQAKQQQMLRQQAAWQQLMGGGGGGGGGQPAAGGGGALDNLLRYAYASQDPDLMAKVMGIQLEAQKAALPYQGMTMADQAAAQDRAMQRELEINRERDAGRLPPAGGVPGAAEAMPGGSPAQGRELYQKGAESLILLDADRLKSLNERAGAAGRMLPSIKRMLTDNANAPSGRLAPTQLWAGQVAESVDGMLGTKFKDWFGGDATIATAEQFFADSANLIREQIKALGSGNAISNVDLLFTRETLPSLMQTKEGRQKMLEALQSDMENLQISAKQADTHFRANKGKGLEGFEPANLKRPAFLKKYFVVGPGGERYEMANKAAAWPMSLTSSVRPTSARK